MYVVMWPLDVSIVVCVDSHRDSPSQRDMKYGTLKNVCATCTLRLCEHQHIHNKL